jgi:RimJ/RimL family protein N-acetyltransferase
MRNTGILPEFQNQGVYKSFLKIFLVFLKEVGFERVTSQHHPHNSRVLATKLRAGFVVQGFEVDERWGPLVKLVYHCHQDRSDYFKNRFQ